MVELDLKKLTRPGLYRLYPRVRPSLMVIDEAEIPSIYWQPREPRLKRQELAGELKEGAEVTG